MLSKPIYELMPYVCLTLGGSSVISHSNVIGVLAGAILYAIGALIWLMRFNHRYPVSCKFSRRGGLLPEQLYECKPFLLFIPIIIMLALNNNTWLTGVAAAMAYHALCIFYQRICNRVKSFAEK